MRILLIILGVWLALAVIGFVVKALFVLGVIAAIAFVATLAVGAGKGISSGR